MFRTLSHTGYVVAIMTVAGLVGAFFSSLYNEMQNDNRRFMEVTKFHVSDAAYGSDHQVDLVRKVSKDFSARYDVTIDQVGGRTMCRSEDVREYISGNGFPHVFSLNDYWGTTSSPQRRCFEWPLPQGCYTINIEWVILDPPNARTITARSNRFCVTEGKA